MSEAAAPRNVLGSVLAGVGVGVVVAGCLGSGAAFFAYTRLTRQATAGWNLVPVVVAAQDLEQGLEVPIDALSQRALPEQFVTRTAVKPDSAGLILGKPVATRVMAGDGLRWFQFGPSPLACVALGRELAAADGGVPSPEVLRVLEAMAVE